MRFTSFTLSFRDLWGWKFINTIWFGEFIHTLHRTCMSSLRSEIQAFKYTIVHMYKHLSIHVQKSATQKMLYLYVFRIALYFFLSTSSFASAQIIFVFHIFHLRYFLDTYVIFVISCLKMCRINTCTSTSKFCHPFIYWKVSPRFLIEDKTSYQRYELSLIITELEHIVFDDKVKLLTFLRTTCRCFWQKKNCFWARVETRQPPTLPFKLNVVLVLLRKNTRFSNSSQTLFALRWHSLLKFTRPDHVCNEWKCAK